jgi:hypothetical protein
VPRHCGLAEHIGPRPQPCATSAKRLRTPSRGAKRRQRRGYAWLVSEANERRGTSSVSQAPVARIATRPRGGQVEQGPCFKGVFQTSRYSRVRLRTAHSGRPLNQAASTPSASQALTVIERTASTVAATVVPGDEQLNGVLWAEGRNRRAPLGRTRRRQDELWAHKK